MFPLRVGRVLVRRTSTSAWAARSFSRAVVALLVSRFLGGIWFVPVLLVFALADFVLARRLGSVVIWYRCNTNIDLQDVSTYRPYDPTSPSATPS
jgi:hypothetical protein